MPKAQRVKRASLVPLIAQDTKKAKRLQRRQKFIEKPKRVIGLRSLPQDLNTALNDLAHTDNAKALSKDRKSKKKAASTKLSNERITTRRGRNQKLANEAERFRKVIDFDIFKTDPLQTIHTHLSNTL